MKPFRSSSSSRSICVGHGDERLGVTPQHDVERCLLHTTDRVNRTHKCPDLQLEGFSAAPKASTRHSGELLSGRIYTQRRGAKEREKQGSLAVPRLYRLECYRDAMERRAEGVTDQSAPVDTRRSDDVEWCLLHTTDRVNGTDTFGGPDLQLEGFSAAPKASTQLMGSFCQAESTHRPRGAKERGKQAL